MSPRIVSATVFLFLFFGGISAQTGSAANLTLIENVSIIDPSANPIRPVKGFVLIDKGRIAFAGSKRPRVKPGAETIDGSGKFLIPGLIDSHTHLANIAGLSFPLKRKYPELASEYYRQLPKSYLYFGFTTLIDTNNHSPEILGRILKETVRPLILTCGEQLEVMNGFMMNETETENRLKRYPNFLHDRFNKNVEFPASVDLKMHTAAASVSKIKTEQGGSCVKMAHENGFGGTEDVTWEMPSKEIVREAKREAERAKIPLLLHASSYESQKFAVETGVDVIAHGMWHWGPLREFLSVKEIPSAHLALLKEIARKRIGYQPTFRVIAGQRDVFDDEFINSANLAHVYSPKLLAWLKTDEGHWQQKNIKKYAKGFFDGKSNPEIVAFMQLMVDKIAVTSKFLADNDAFLLLGSDSPASNAHTNPPGLNGYLEMREWHAAGIPLETILKAATINNAKAFRIDNTRGGIRKTMAADLLLLNKNPLEDFSAYDSIDKVFVSGKMFERSTLSAANFTDR